MSEMSTAVEQINLVTQSVAANAEEGSSASVELRERAEQLVATVSAFSVETPPARAQRSASPRPAAPGARPRGVQMPAAFAQ
jgi:hypothetical protein